MAYKIRMKTKRIFCKIMDNMFVEKSFYGTVNRVNQNRISQNTAQIISFEFGYIGERRSLKT